MNLRSPQDDELTIIQRLDELRIRAKVLELANTYCSELRAAMAVLSDDLIRKILENWQLLLSLLRSDGSEVRVAGEKFLLVAKDPAALGTDPSIAVTLARFHEGTFPQICVLWNIRLQALSEASVDPFAKIVEDQGLSASISALIDASSDETWKLILAHPSMVLQLEEFLVTEECKRWLQIAAPMEPLPPVDRMSVAEHSAAAETIAEEIELVEKMLASPPSGSSFTSGAVLLRRMSNDRVIPQALALTPGLQTLAEALNDDPADVVIGLTNLCQTRLITLRRLSQILADSASDVRGFSARLAVFISGLLADECSCPICCALIEQAAVLTCGHSTCTACIERLHSPAGYKCPFCSVVSPLYVVPRVYDQLISALQLHGQ